MSVTSGVYYKLLCPKANYKGIWFEPYMNWDYMRVVDEPGTGVSIKFLETSPGRYKIESASSNWGGYTFFQADGSGIKLTSQAEATEWEVIPNANGHVFIRHSDGQSLLLAKNIFSDKHWLDCAGSYLGDPSWEWKLELV
ncbi:hypothetical protein [Priestia megaterium]|uniref:hypothetical protein n=1 Tax=Priestia megaterium TaxID=1404 RepID=UPI001126A904|nr:hypothetical protein [Priestia megaterium]TPF18420.1 hypothetical protein CBE78_04120 [Priestia megaterium]TPF22530.1 hypothetical protein CBE79_06630 [Priestia megaterium]